MPRAGWKKPISERRLSDLVSVGLLTRVFPPEVVDEVVAECGRTEQRHRSLPARVMAYFAVGLALHSEGSYEDVLGLMTDGLAWAEPGAEPVRLPSKSAIFQARDRLGAEPVKALFERVAQPLARLSTPGAWLAGRRLVAIDGTTLDVADTDVNDEWFGRPGVNKGERSAFPQARVVALAECGTHAIFDAVIGAYTTRRSSWPACWSTGSNRACWCSLIVASTGFRCGHWRRTAVRSCCGGANSTQRLDPIEIFDDGSWLAKIYQIRNYKRRGEGLVVRVIDYSIDDGRDDDRPLPAVHHDLLDPSRGDRDRTGHRLRTTVGDRIGLR